MVGLKENSCRVIDGKIYKYGKELLNTSCMLVYGDEFVAYGDVGNMRTNLLHIHKLYEEAGKDIMKIHLYVFDMNFARDYNIDDVCYLIRRSEEYSGTGFILEVTKRWNSRSFWRWLREERKLFPIQTKKNDNK